MIIVKVNSIKSLHGWSVCSQLYSLRAVWVFTAHAHVPHFPIVKTTVHTLSYIDNWYYCTICKSSWLTFIRNYCLLLGNLGHFAEYLGSVDGLFNKHQRPKVSEVT